MCCGTSNPPKVIRDLYTFTPAILDGYCRHRVQAAEYPAIIAEKDHKVRGIYATGLTDANMDKLDFFEGSEYERIKVNVKLLKNDGGNGVEGEEKETSVYVFKHPDALERVEWDFEHFRNEKMKAWTRGDWAYEQGQSTTVVRAVKETLTDTIDPRPQ